MRLEVTTLIEADDRAKNQDPPQPPVEEVPALEALIDETLEATFPASDPPAWGSAAARAERIEDER